MRSYILIAAIVLSGTGLTAALADDAVPAVVLSPQDLQQLSPKARRELQELIARKRALPPGAVPGRDGGVDVNLGPLFRSNVEDGNVDVRVLGGLIRINRGGRQPAAANEPVVILDDAPQFGDAPPHGQPAVAASRFRIGISGNTLLPGPNAPAGSGLGVYLDDVEADSPADDAGLKPKDIITAVDGKAIKTLENMVAAVDARNGEPVTLTVARGQEVFETQLTPAPNAAAPTPGSEPAPAPAAEVEIPDDMAISVTKVGSEPATITVSRGDKQWSVRRDQMAQLPDDVRPYVQQLLNQSAPARVTAPPQPGPEFPDTNSGKTPSKPVRSTVPSPVVPGVDLGDPSTLP